MHQNDGNTTVIILRPSSPAHHLKDVSDGVVHVALGFAIKELRSLHNDQVCREIDSPGQRAGGYQNLWLSGQSYM